MYADTTGIMDGDGSGGKEAHEVTPGVDLLDDSVMLCGCSVLWHPLTTEA
jgi:hypothetical protein